MTNKKELKHSLPSKESKPDNENQMYFCTPGKTKTETIAIALKTTQRWKTMLCIIFFFCKNLSKSNFSAR